MFGRTILRWGRFVGRCHASRLGRLVHHPYQESEDGLSLAYLTLFPLYLADQTGPPFGRFVENFS